ncbi:hypothetical protein H4219_003609 [Mycoemilia scoparia]|uniref:RRM domain-containing protein n=1 Tax=Mycoemilia scoparia TaxID=417184 RepID=A0A9W8A294_9FUNG|nr:hypothetical protein H4219_003609 [Mycoemilia scoparia]
MPNLREIDQRTVYIEGLKKPYDSIDTIKDLASQIDKVATVRPHKDSKTGVFHGFAFVEFCSEEGARKALSYSSSHRDQFVKKESQSNKDQDGASGLHALGLRIISKARWNELKKEYLKYQEYMQQDLERPEGVKRGSILRFHGVSPDSDRDAIEKSICKGMEYKNIEYAIGQISGHIEFKSSDDARKALQLHSMDDSTQSQTKTPTGTGNPGIRVKVLKGWEEVNYWAQLKQRKRGGMPADQSDPASKLQITKTQQNTLMHDDASECQDMSTAGSGGTKRKASNIS